MTYDPNRMHDYSDRVVGYGADHRSSGFYAVLSMGVLIALVAIFYLIDQVGGSRTEHANNPNNRAQRDAGAVVDGASAVNAADQRQTVR